MSNICWFQLFKVRLDNLFVLTLALWCITWLNCVIVVEKWRHSLLNWSPINSVFTMRFSLPPGRGFHGRVKDQWRSLHSPSLFSGLRLATGDVSTSWLAHRALTRLCQQQSVSRRHRQSARARAETDQFTPLQLSLQPFGLSSDWT